MKQLTSPRLLAYALMMALPLWFGSCKKDDADVVTPTSIEGNWKLTSMKVNPAIDGGPFGKIEDLLTFLRTLSASTCVDDITITFNANGTTSQNNPPSCQSADEVTDVVGSNNGSKWKLDGNKLTLTEADGTATVYDVVINGNTMQWSYATEIPDVNDVPTKTTVTVGLKRV